MTRFTRSLSRAVGIAVIVYTLPASPAAYVLDEASVVVDHATTLRKQSTSRSGFRPAVAFNVVENSEVGRWKLDGNGGCYWDEDDTGGDQCDPSDPAGRYRLDGGNCVWAANEHPPNACTPGGGGGGGGTLPKRLSIAPTQGENNPVLVPEKFIEACMNMHLWTQSGRYVHDMGVNDHQLGLYADQNPSTVSTCFSNLRAYGVDLSLGVPAIKDHCQTGAQCYSNYSVWWRLLKNSFNGPLVTLKMDEPLTVVLARDEWLTTGRPRDYQYALQQTADFIQLVRNDADFANMTLVLQEGYPAVSATTLQNFVTDLKAACLARSVRCFDYFELDHDWNAGGNTTEIANLRAHVRAQGFGFGAIFWSNGPNYPDGNDQSWYNGVMFQADLYARAGLLDLDLYSLDSWRNVPLKIAPDLLFTNSFMGTLHTFITQYYPINLGVPTGTDVLNAEEALYPDQQIFSADGRFRLAYQSDGNLVLYRWDGQYIWASHTAGTSPGQLLMQGDGNLVLYDANGNAVWWTGTNNNNAGAYLMIQSDGNLVIYSSTYASKWATNTGWW